VCGIEQRYDIRASADSVLAAGCTQDDIVINTFMLETSNYLLDFVDRLTRANRGRALYTTPDKLGEYVMVDYLSNRKRRVVS
jgi:uncharacterized protein with von Willebrand factor type A (vWA) domain